MQFIQPTTKAVIKWKFHFNSQLPNATLSNIQVFEQNLHWCYINLYHVNGKNKHTKKKPKIYNTQQEEQKYDKYTGEEVQ